LLRLDLFRLLDVEVVTQGKFFDRRLNEFIAAPGRAIRLSPDRDDTMSVFKAAL
jgi:hypothetical protein